MARTTTPSQIRSVTPLRPVADVQRRTWPARRGAVAFDEVAVPGLPRFWLRQDVLSYALIALGPQRVEAIVATVAAEPAADDRWEFLPNGQRICDRTGAFIRTADWLFPAGSRESRAIRLAAAPRGLQAKLEHDPAYDLSDMDLEALVRTYRRYCHQPHHPVTLACLRELARRQRGMAS